MRRLMHGTDRRGQRVLRAIDHPTLPTYGRMIKRTLLIALAAPAILAGPASAADFNPAPGSYTVNTSTLKLTGPGGTNITGTDQSGVAVFSFGTVNIPAGVTVSAAGTRPFKIVAAGA